MNDRLWAPWRLEYILGEKEEECIFCAKPEEEKDRENLILYRGKLNFVILNRFPYNNGHMMVVPYRHVQDITDMTGEEMDENGRIIKLCVKVLKERFRPEGFNLGTNIGKAAGAGIDAHVHMHIVPRWNGDTNYMPVVGQTHVMPQHIEETYDALIEGFKGTAG